MHENETCPQRRIRGGEGWGRGSSRGNALKSAIKTISGKIVHSTRRSIHGTLGADKSTCLGAGAARAGVMTAAFTAAVRAVANARA